MPTFNAMTKQSQSIWRSPDGQREIFKVTFDVEGQAFEAKTFSKDIAQLGWSGTVETYEKEGKFGPETYAKQPPKEGGFPSQPGSPASSTGGRSSKGFSTDNFTMYLSYAKDAAIASVHEGKFDSDLYQELLAAIEAGGNQLFDGHENPTETTKPLDMKDIDTVFPDREPL